MTIFILILGVIFPTISYSQELKIACEVRETKKVPEGCQLSGAKSRFEATLNEYGASKRIDSSFDANYRFEGSVTIFNRTEKYLHARIEYARSIPANPQNPYPVQYVSRAATAGRDKAQLYDTVVASFSDSKVTGPDNCEWKTNLMVCILAKLEDPWDAFSAKVDDRFKIEAKNK